MSSLPFHPKRYLTAQLFWRFFLLSLPVLLIGGVALCYAALAQLRMQASENLAGIAADRASKIEAYARGKLREIQFLAAQPYMPGLVAEGKTTAEQQAPLAFLRNVGDYQNLYLFSQEGKLLFTQNPSDAPTPELARTIDRTRTLMSEEISDYTLDPRHQDPRRLCRRSNLWSRWRDFGSRRRPALQRGDLSRGQRLRKPGPDGGNRDRPNRR